MLKAKKSRVLSVLIAKQTLVRLAIVVATVLGLETSFVATGSAVVQKFSQAQINSYLKIVTDEIELLNNRGANFGASATSKVYCYPTVFGEGARNGARGLYAWVTCSAMRKLELKEISSSSPACSGFSVPVWIQANATSVTYRAIASGAEYIAFKSSAPSEVQIGLDAMYKQIYASGRQSHTPSTIKGKTASSFASLSNCN